jgi:hypothetical protein
MKVGCVGCVCVSVCRGVLLALLAKLAACQGFAGGCS